MSSNGKEPAADATHIIVEPDGTWREMPGATPPGWSQSPPPPSAPTDPASVARTEELAAERVADEERRRAYVPGSDPDNGRRWAEFIAEDPNMLRDFGGPRPGQSERDYYDFLDRRLGLLVPGCNPYGADVEMALLPPPSEPVAVARVFLDGYQSDGVPTLRHWRGAWMQWRDGHWPEVEDAAIHSAMYQRLEHAVYEHVVDKQVEFVPWRPNRARVANVLDACRAVAHLPAEVDAPAWLEADGASPAAGWVACANGLLHVETRQPHLLTPRFFNRLAVPFDYDPDAPSPERWLAFLDQLWPGDTESVAALQEWFGYVLSGRTDLQKILLIVGPRRSGKGTIARVLAALVGAGNVAGPTLASLGENFGLSPLLGKPLAIVSDARLGGANVHQVVERLLSVSGEDMLTVDRKYREPWTGKLPARFAIMSNELPRFGDASGAIATRFVTLMLERSFLGHEDTLLTEALLAELPGILLWSLDGLDRIATAPFTVPASSADAVIALEDLVSPVSEFVRDQCMTGGEFSIEVSALYRVWMSWCMDSGQHPGTVQQFGRDLRAVLPKIAVTRPHGQPRRYVGIAAHSDGLAVQVDWDDLLRVAELWSRGHPEPQ